MGSKKSAGRPTGRIKTEKIEIAIDPETKKEFMEMVHSNGTTASGLIGMWIHDYIKNSRSE